jgi:hypothetical protein
MQSAIGRETGRSVSYPVSVSDIRRWAVAVYYPEEPPRLYWDEEFAAQTVHGGIVAPEEFNPFAWMSAEPAGVPRQVGGYDPDHTEKVLGVDPPGLRNLLNGGIDVHYGVRMRPGDVITSISRLAGYKEREGRLGLMLFTNSETEWTNQEGQLVKRTTGTLIRY